MDPAEVEKLRVAYNKEHPHEKPIAKGREVWHEITRRLREVCDTGAEQCVVRALIKKPTAPDSWASSGTEWLSSEDIDKAQKYYTELIPDYYYTGSVPIDFDTHSETGACLVSSLCSMKISELHKKGYRRVGIVFNTDPSDGPGEHWIAAFCDFRDHLKHPRMTYFDSYAQKPEKEVQRLMNRWKEQLDETKMFEEPTELSYNALRHQFKNSQCGMYCIYFLHCCLFEIPMDEQIPDDVVMMMRPLFFNYKQRRSKK
jgi:hypothetical protein